MRNFVGLRRLIWLCVWAMVLCPLSADAQAGRAPLPGAVILSNLPTDSCWWYGCTPTAAGMLFGYWENQGIDAYPGSQDNMPSSFPHTSSNPADFTDARGVVAGWANAQSGVSSGLTYGSWTGHYADSLADFLLTQNGASGRADYALMNFGAWDDPRTPEIESRKFDANQVSTFNLGTNLPHYFFDWTYQDYVSEIDAGRPMMLSLDSGIYGHSVLGVGYNNTAGKQDYVLLTAWGPAWGLQEWEWANETATGTGWSVNGGTEATPLISPTPQLSAYFHIDRNMEGWPSSPDGMTVTLGRGNPDSPDWSMNVPVDIWTTTQTDIDLTSQINAFGSNEQNWFLKVTYDHTGDTIMDFQIRYGFDQLVFKSADSPVTIVPGMSAIMYLTTQNPEPVAGDLDHDCDVDIFDWAIFQPNFGSSGMTYDDGDLDGDGDVDIFDWAIFQPNYGTNCGNPIPEPATLILLALGAVAMLKRRK